MLRRTLPRTRPSAEPHTPEGPLVEPHEAIAQSLRDSPGPALIAFLTAGYPDPDRFVEVLEQIEARADAVEIGVPFTDPMADGVTIQRSSHAAIGKGVGLKWILDRLAARATPPGAPLLLMSYLNPLLALGFDRLAARAVEARVSGFIVPDLPFEESAPLRASLEPAGLALVQLVTPATPAARLAELCRHSQGFVYAVTRTGITGGAANLPDDLTRYLRTVKAHARVPVCAGFGVRSREQAARIGRHADGVIVGSALVEALEAGAAPGDFLAGLRP